MVEQFWIDVQMSPRWRCGARRAPAGPRLARREAQRGFARLEAGAGALALEALGGVAAELGAVLAAAGGGLLAGGGAVGVATLGVAEGGGQRAGGRVLEHADERDGAAEALAESHARLHHQ